jgi:UDP-N-acetylmuramyl tripeptide synthase
MYRTVGLANRGLPIVRSTNSFLANLLKRQRSVIEKVDRAKAIQKAYTRATHSAHSAIIALLGKGPDEYQVIQGQKHTFNERSILQELMI